MRRGDVVVAAGGGGFGGKPRPYAVVQSDYLRTSTVILVGCHAVEGPRIELRPLIVPSERNGLKHPSEIMVDIPVTMRMARIDATIGRLAQADLDSVDAALLVVLGFADVPA